MRRHLLTSLLAALLAASATASLSVAGKDDDDDGGGGKGSSRSYSIGLWGDLPYSEEQRTEGVPNLIDDMNDADLALTVHDGDIKSGGSKCTDEVYAQAEAFFNSFEAPSVYTPGDNEWTDCDRQGDSSRERLEYLRENLFDKPRSFGQRRIRLEQQDEPCVETRCVENVRFRIGRVVFAGLHVVGSNNNLGDVGADPEEYEQRNDATNEWLEETFEEAEDENARAVFLFSQANPGFDESDPTRAPLRDPRTLRSSDGRGNGFDEFLEKLREETIEFRRPVVLNHGDSHYMRIDKPLQDEEGRRVENFTRLETPGDNPQNGNNDVQWVKVNIDTRSREVFSFEPQVVPENRVAVPEP